MGIINFDFQNLSQEALFWLHVIFIVAAVSLGLFVTPLVAFVLIIFHRAHVFFFGECLLSKIQKRMGSLPKDISFLQLASKRFFQKDISRTASRILDYSLAVSVLAISLVK
jgi:hypothetical protein